VIELLRAAAARVPFPVHEFRADPDVPADPANYPYVVLWADLGERFTRHGPRATSLADLAPYEQLAIRATYVGLGVEAVDIVARRTRDALDRVTLRVPGWVCQRMKVSPVLGIDSDESVQIDHGHPYFAVDEYTLTALRRPDA